MGSNGSRLKIVYGVHHFPPTYTGGAEQRAQRTALALQGRGHSVSVVCVEHIDKVAGSGNLSSVECLEDDLMVRRLSVDLNQAPDLFKWEYQNEWVGDYLSEIFESQRPDIFHLFSGYLMTGSAIEAAAKSKVPIVISLTDFWFLCRRIGLVRSDGRLSRPPVNAAVCASCVAKEQRRFQWLNAVTGERFMQRWLVQSGLVSQMEGRQKYLQARLFDADVLIAPSRFLRSVYIDAGVPSDQIKFMRQGRDLPTVDRRPSIEGERPVIGYVGQLTHLKGVHVIIDALCRRPDLDCQLKLYGRLDQDTAYVNHLKSIIGDDDRIELCGPFDRETIGAVYAGMSVMVIASLWYENSPNVILEAQHYGVPVIAANHGGMAEMVSHNVDGLHFEVGDGKSLADQIERVCLEDGLIERLRSGIRPIKPLAEEIDEIEAIYQNLAQARFGDQTHSDQGGLS